MQQGDRVCYSVMCGFPESTRNMVGSEEMVGPMRMAQHRPEKKKKTNV